MPTSSSDVWFPSRRELLVFLGSAAGCAALPVPSRRASAPLDARSAPDSGADALLLSDGLTAQVVLRYGDALNAQGARFGYDCDMVLPLPALDVGPGGLALWVNHEYPHPLFVNGAAGRLTDLEAVRQSQRATGGSVVALARNAKGRWALKPNHPLNRRLDGRTRIPFVSEAPVAGAREAEGLIGNCGGGLTPWDTVLTCEENFQDFFGEVDPTTGARTQSVFGWEDHLPHPFEHYGWVAEVDPRTGAAKKLTGLGRFCHEGAAVRVADDGRVVVYMGDDGVDRCLYKFVSSRPGTLDEGTLYVANLEARRWIPLVREQHAVLQARTAHQTEVMVRCREAAQWVGGTPLDRPEDIKVDPRSGAVVLALTNNKPHGRPYGSLFKLVEDGADPRSPTFQHSVLLAGGPQAGFACPDNLAFDRNGNLWFTIDIDEAQLGQGPYASFRSNGLFHLTLHGPRAGALLRVASAPKDSELCSPAFSPDGRTLFFSVQHPGSRSTSMDALTSHWPDGGDAVPAPSVVAVEGPLLDALLHA